MRTKNKDLHGSAPDESRVALLIIDMINDFDFTDGERFAEKTLPVAQAIAGLKEKAKLKGIPVIYVNDNFGRWKSDFNILIDHCIKDATPGKKIAELLLPDEDDYFVLKPKHSGFYSTTLDLLLQYLNSDTLILTGISTDICILFTANDAYMRDFKLLVPTDCTAAIREDDHVNTLEYLQRIHGADIRPSADVI